MVTHKQYVMAQGKESEEAQQHYQQAAQLHSQIISRSIRVIRGAHGDGRVGYLAAHGQDRPVQLLDDDGSRQLDYERDHATINGAVAMMDGLRCTKCVYAGATAISGWLLCESRRCFCHG
eukprot:scaffold160888_cov43-Cyclotella_meneghiniana.AAC.1